MFTNRICNIKPSNLLLSSAILGSLLFATPFAQTAKAQTVDLQTGIAAPDRVRGQIKQDDFIPRVQPQIEVRNLEIQGAPAGSDDVIFTLTKLILEDATIYKNDELGALYDDYLGKDISLTDLYRIAAEITRYYRNNGYILTQVIVPVQSIENGIATLKIIEGYVDRIEVRGEGQKQKELDLIAKYVDHIKSSNALDAANLERALLLVNDLPGVSARSILSPSSGRVGAADLLVIVERKDYDAQIGLDNYGTRFLGPFQWNASGSLNSSLGLNERITVQTVAAVDGLGDSIGEGAELGYFSLRYDQPIFSQGTQLSLIASYTNTNPGFTLDEFDVNGISRNYSAVISHPFIRTRTLNFTGRATFDYRDITSTNNLIAVDTLNDRLRVLRFGGNVEFLDTLVGTAFNSLDFEYSRGLDLFNSSDIQDTDVSRPGARAEFNKLEVTAQRLQRVNNNLNVLVALTGQITGSDVFSAEEFSVGGINYGRGFDSSEIIGNDGYAGKVELQWNTPYPVHEDLSYQVLGFFDAGRVFDTDATATSLEEATITSTGFGVRADLYDNTAASALLAFPLNDTPSTEDDRDPRLLFNLSHRF